MNLEIVALYEDDRNDAKELLNGTLHLHFIDIGIDLRGIYFSKRKDAWFFRIPNRKIENGGFYPVFALRDRSLDLLALIKEKAIPFIENYIKCNPELSENQQLSKQMSDLKTKNIATEAKQTTSISAAPATVKPKVWIDPPKPKMKLRNQQKASYGR